MKRLAVFLFLLTFAFPVFATSSSDDFNAPVTVSESDEPSDDAMKAIYDAASGNAPSRRRRRW